jgi:hypothetical protein
MDPLLKLKGALDEAQTNSKKMLTKLQRFEDRLGSLEHKMKPIQISSSPYTLAKSNVESTLKQAEKTYEYFRVANEVENDINSGLNINDNNKSKDFYLSITRLTKAKEFFETNRKDIKSAGSALTRIDTVLSKGISKLSDEFEKLLLLCNPYIKIIYDKVHSKYVQVIELESSIIKDNMKNYEEIIKHMIDVMDSNNIKVHYNIYEKVRSEHIKGQLKANIVENAKKWEEMNDDIPYEKGRHPFEIYFNLLYEIITNELKMWEKIFTYTPDSIKTCVNICNNINIELDTILSPIWEEIDITNIKVKKSNIVLKQINTFLIRLDAFDILMKKYDELQDQYKPDNQKETIASMALTKIRDSLLESCAESVGILTKTISYDGNVSYTSKDKKSNEEDDWICDLHPVTGNVLHCCKQIAKFSIYKQVLSLAVTVDISTQSPLPDTGEFINIMLEKLLLGIQLMASKFNNNKSGNGGPISRELHVKTHKLYEAGGKEAEELLSSSRKHLFMINNTYSILTYIREKKKEITQMNTASHASNTKPNIHDQKLLIFLETLETKFTDEKSNFCDKVGCVMGMNTEDMEEFNDRYIKDKAGQYRLLKAKFSMFNSGMDAFLAQQGEWRVSSASLREHLGELLVESIYPTYLEFFTTYSIIPFSKKHMAGYLKYQPKMIEDKLKHFFGK